MRMLMGLAMLLASGACGQAPPAKQPAPEQPSMMAITPVMFMADDGLTVSGNFYRADKPKALILLFHQAGSSKEEYATIAPKLVEAGYSALAVDQRSGGNMFGKNETAARMPQGASYGDALHDLDAALSWARTMNLPVIIWGSSYSSSLVFELAAKHPGEVSALLSFSPGEYLGPGTPVRDAAAKVKVPVFVTAAKNADELRAAKAIFEAVPATEKMFATPAVAGVHGSSTLIDTHNPKGAEDNWQPVLAFLKKVAA
jgi:dienelactone hydrolase